MRPLVRTALAATLTVSVAACLATKPPASDGAASSVTGATSADPDVESLRKSSAGGFRDFYILSPEDSQTEDPSLVIKLVKVAKLHHGRIGIVLDFQNHRDAALDGSQVTGTLVDEDERAMPVVAKPSETVAANASEKLVWIFDASDAHKGSLEMRLDVPGTKTWPVVFSKDKPPDFKPTPNPNEQGPGPGGPGGLGGAPGY